MAIIQWLSFALKIRNDSHTGERKPAWDFSVVKQAPAKANGKPTAILCLDIYSPNKPFPIRCSNTGIRVSKNTPREMEKETRFLQIPSFLWSPVSAVAGTGPLSPPAPCSLLEYHPDSLGSTYRTPANLRRSVNFLSECAAKQQVHVFTN